LPNPSSLRNWTMSVNAEPGFQRDVFSALKQFNDEDRDCNLVFDSMAIRKQVMWNKQCQKYIGYCNYDNELHLEGSNTVATEALVFMLVGINGKWKWPIGYFFIDKIKAVIQAELIKTALILAGDAG
ncbi:THAP domain-containing protein 9, partial [Camponotus floridanus]